MSVGRTDLGGVVAEPVVRLSEVVKNDAAAVTSAGRQDDWGRGVGFAGHPGRVEGVCDEEESHDQNHPTGNLEIGQHKYNQFTSNSYCCSNESMKRLEISNKIILWSWETVWASQDLSLEHQIFVLTHTRQL